MLYIASRQSFGVAAVTLPDGLRLTFSLGEHNQLQAQVIALFAPQFASGALLLYLGDTADKDLYITSQ
jgi:type II restriction enzyme